VINPDCFSKPVFDSPSHPRKNSFEKDYSSGKKVKKLAQDFVKNKTISKFSNQPKAKEEMPSI
jgi:hypothetical protein